jgi:hypothetical protein
MLRLSLLFNLGSSLKLSISNFLSLICLYLAPNRQCCLLLKCNRIILTGGNNVLRLGSNTISL